MNIQDLIEQLQDIAEQFGPDTEVRIATQPSWPFENDVAEVAHSEETGAVYLAEGHQRGYLPGVVKDELGW